MSTGAVGALAEALSGDGAALPVAISQDVMPAIFGALGCRGTM